MPLVCIDREVTDDDMGVNLAIKQRHASATLAEPRIHGS